MTTTTIHLPVADAFGQLTARATGLGSQLLAALLGLAVLIAGIWLIIQIGYAMMRSPSLGKLLGICGIALAAVFLVGAAPDGLQLAYDEGRAFFRSDGWATDDPTVEVGGVEIDVTNSEAVTP